MEISEKTLESFIIDYLEKPDPVKFFLSRGLDIRPHKGIKDTVKPIVHRQQNMGWCGRSDIVLIFPDKDEFSATVIELKRHTFTCDDVGQTIRYVSWVRNKLNTWGNKTTKQVKGILVSSFDMGSNLLRGAACADALLLISNIPMLEYRSVELNAEGLWFGKKTSNTITSQSPKIDFDWINGFASSKDTYIYDYLCDRDHIIGKWFTKLIESEYPDMINSTYRDIVEGTILPDEGITLRLT